MSEPIALYWWVPSAEKISAGDPALQRSNFGDDLSAFIVEKLSGRAVVRKEHSPKLLAVGSVIFKADEGDIVWGSGMIGTSSISLPKSHNIDVRAVRGPLTHQAMTKYGIFCPPIFGDPALLLPRLYGGYHNPKRAWGVIPHIDRISEYASYRDNIIDVRWPWQRVVDEILACELIISSSLHGIIVAEAYGIPAVWLTPCNGMFKYHDYYLSTGRQGHPAASVEEALARPRKPVLLNLDTKALLHAFPYPPPHDKTA